MFKRTIKEAIFSLLTISILVACIYMVLESYKAGVTYQKYIEIPRQVWNEQQHYKLSDSTSSLVEIYTLTDWRIAKEQGFPWFIKLFYSNKLAQQEQQNLPYLCGLQRQYRKRQQQTNEQIEFDKEAFKDVPKKVFDPDSVSIMMMTYKALQQKAWQEVDKINCEGVTVYD